MNSAQYESLLELCEQSPEDALLVADKYAANDGDTSLLRFARLYCYKLLSIGHSSTTRRFLGDDEPTKATLVSRGLAQIREIESAEADFFDKNEARREVRDELCGLAESLEPGVVQRELGWTKLKYWGPDRFFTTAGIDPEVGKVAQRMRKAIGEAKLDEFPTIALGACACMAFDKGAKSSIQIEFFEETGEPTDDMTDRGFIGSVVIGMRGGARFDEAGNREPMTGRHANCPRCRSLNSYGARFCRECNYYFSGGY
jgi:hypothetical protein